MEIETSLSEKEMKVYLEKQLLTFFPDGRLDFDTTDVSESIHDAYARLDYCFSHIIRKGYRLDNHSYFNHMHSDQYAVFLYYLSNSLWKMSENRDVCDRLIYLNKVLNGIWTTYRVELPSIMMFEHPLGTVLGHATYNDFFLVTQGCTVATGDVIDGIQYPVIGKGVAMRTGAIIVGNRSVGNYVQCGANSFNYGKDIPDYCDLINSDGKSIVKQRNGNWDGYNVFEVTRDCI